MKEVMSLATFALGVLCFVAVRPTAISAVQAAPTIAEAILPVCGDATCMSSQQCQAPSGNRGNLAPPRLMRV